MNFMEELRVKGRGKGSRSSNVNEVIRAILSFIQKDFTRTTSAKRT